MNKTSFREPEGLEFLRAVAGFISRCEARTDEFLLAAQDLSETSSLIGTLLSLLDRASSCYWRCRGGDHHAEQLIGRSNNYAMAALRVARSGFYDESIALIRTVGENTNLALLFSLDATALPRWRTETDRQRRDEFSPVKVRTALERLSTPLPVDQHRYAQLSSKSVHATPHIPSQMYNAERTSPAAGTFQEAGMSFCLAELGHALSALGPCAATICGLTVPNTERLVATAADLRHSLRGPRARVNATFPGTYS
jgi:hypothetical protein